ncbi:family 20 glycosylhydrolase [Sphingomonas sp. I4]
MAEAHGQANRGWKTVLSIPDLGYFDMPYAADPNETGYDWASRGVDSFQVFGFMPGNLAANAALIPDILAQPKAIGDTVPLQPGRSIAGIQAQLWSETVRRDTQVDYMLFPACWRWPNAPGASRTGSLPMPQGRAMRRAIRASTAPDCCPDGRILRAAWACRCGCSTGRA